ncbi:MAG: glycosyltransferase [Lachnospiraceae bacterium]|nr:glycosyltransferase [Lachnospiraceae bacterium]
MKTVSVITTTYKDADHLREVANGLMAQSYPCIEYVIVDGGMDEETAAFVEEFKQSFTAREGRSLRFISEPDLGIYDAINKGIRAASGDVIGTIFDRFADENVISELVTQMEKEGADGVHGDVTYVDEKGNVVRFYHMGPVADVRKGWMPAHPTLYLKREVFDTYGLYKADYRIAGDYEYVVRITKDKNLKLAYVPKVLVRMYYGGTSSGGLKAYARSFSEGVRALRENGVHPAFLITVLRTVRAYITFHRREKA